jgi:hypothetical protein
MQANAALSLRYIAPGNVSSTMTMAAVLAYVGSAAGFIDVPEAAVDGTSYAVPFGSVAAPKLVAVQNNTLLPVEISINASEDVWNLGAGDLMILGGPTALGITSVSAILTGTQTADGQIAFVVLGDDATP